MTAEGVVMLSVRNVRESDGLSPVCETLSGG
jgi:hypothetical protein